MWPDRPCPPRRAVGACSVLPVSGSVTGVQVVPAGQGQLDRLQQVQVVVHRAGAVVAHHGVLQAADRGVVVHVAGVDQVLHPRLARFQHHPRHGALVEVQQERRALAGGDHLHHFVQQRLRAAAVQAHVGLGLQDGRHLVDHFQHGVGQVVGHVQPGRAHAREGDQLPVARR